MQENTKLEKSQAEALSAAIDALNRGIAPDEGQDDEITELLHTARLVKEASGVTMAAPPPAVLEHLVDQAASTIAREKRKRKMAWGFASVTSAVAAVALVALLQVMPPVTPEQQLARTMPPAAVTEPPPAPSITQPPPNLITPPAESRTPVLPVTPAPEAPAGRPEAAAVSPAADEPPRVALMPPQSPVPAASETMLALAERKADLVTIDAVTKTIRQVYHQGAPDEIIITQAPKIQRSLRTAPKPPEVRAKMAAPVPNESVEIKPK